MKKMKLRSIVRTCEAMKVLGYLVWVAERGFRIVSVTPLPSLLVNMHPVPPPDTYVVVMDADRRERNRLERLEVKEWSPAVITARASTPQRN